MVVEQFHTLDFPVQETLHQFLSQSGSLLIVRLAAHVLEIAHRHNPLHLLHGIGHFAPHRIDEQVLTPHLFAVLVDQIVQMTDNICVKAAAQATVRSKHYNGNLFHLMIHDERRLHCQPRTQKIGKHAV